MKMDRLGNSVPKPAVGDDGSVVITLDDGLLSDADAAVGAVYAAKQKIMTTDYLGDGSSLAAKLDAVKASPEWQGVNDELKREMDAEAQARDDFKNAYACVVSKVSFPENADSNIVQAIKLAENTVKRLLDGDAGAVIDFLIQ